MNVKEERNIDKAKASLVLRAYSFRHNFIQIQFGSVKFSVARIHLAQKNKA